MKSALAALVIGALAVQTALAQTQAAPLIAAARLQLDNANPDSAAKLLERALDPPLGATEAEQTRAWYLYGIAQLMLERAPSARQAFRRALERDPALRLDSLDYLHENLLREFNAERAAVAPAPVAALPLTVVPEVPADTQVAAERGAFRITTHPSYGSRVIVTITPADAPGQIVWGDTGSLADRHTSVWNLRGRDGAIVASGRYVLLVRAVDSLGQASPVVERVLEVSRVAVDTQPHPAPLGPGDLRPETVELKRGSPAGLAVGLALGAAAALLPTALGATELNTGLGGDGTAYAVAGAVSLAGIVGFMAGKRVRFVPGNARYNAELMERNARDRQAAVEQNRRLLEAAPIRIRREASGP